MKLFIIIATKNYFQKNSMGIFASFSAFDFCCMTRFSRIFFLLKWKMESISGQKKIYFRMNFGRENSNYWRFLRFTYLAQKFRFLKICTLDSFLAWKFKLTDFFNYQVTHEFEFSCQKWSKKNQQFFCWFCNLHKITIFDAKIQIIQVKLALKIPKNHCFLAQKIKIHNFEFFLKIEFFDTIWDFLTACVRQ